jgi:PPOX class probable F420-dependent enzyme
MYSKVTYGIPIRGSKPLTTQQVNEFLAEPRNCILGTTNQDGSSQLTPVGFLWDGTAFYIIADKQRHWVKRNLQRDPRMSLVVDQGDEYRAVVAKGKAEIQDQAIGEMTKQILVKYFGEETGAAYFDELEERENPNRILVVLKPDQIQSWARDDGEEN